MKLSSLSRQYVNVPVTAPADPTANVVQMAFTDGSEPGDTDWVSGSWEKVGSRYRARALVGPGGDKVLPNGSYVVWLRVTAAPEAPVFKAGLLIVT